MQYAYLNPFAWVVFVVVAFNAPATLLGLDFKVDGVLSVFLTLPGWVIVVAWRILFDPLAFFTARFAPASARELRRGTQPLVLLCARQVETPLGLTLLTGQSPLVR
ncbi:MAG: hypothetical protein VKO21_01610 [Candidatus Sericytochromatia bacterium]|nr:hypothetical protein [Candidatus Sericytochromatia bacterium]